MKTFDSIKDFQINNKTIVTIGVFDGVHLGHLKIIEKLQKLAISTPFETVVLTFFPHPKMVLRPDLDLKLLNTQDEKIFLLEKSGLQNLIIQPFDKDFSELRAEDFVKTILVDKLRVHQIIIGHDHQFGKNRSATIIDLIEFGKKYGFLVSQISAEDLDQVTISSSTIRKSITDGAIKQANKYLGYSYFFSGKVVKGNQLGRTIGYPTANFSITEKQKLIPKNGVYIVKSFLNNQWVFGMMNIGFKPTIGSFELSIEVHYLDFDNDLYDQNITVHVLDYCRPEIKFSSLQELKNQLHQDKMTTKIFIEGL